MSPGNRAPFSQTQLMAYADGRLSDAERTAVEAYLAGNAEAAAEVALWQRQNEAIAALYPLPAERGPERPSPERLARTARPGLVRLSSLAAAAAVLVLLGGLAGWLGRDLIEPGLSPGDRLIARATVAHMLYTRENRHAVEVAAAESPHLLSWLSNRLGTPVRAPDLSAHGFDLVGGRLLPPDPEAGAGPAAQLMYENATAERLTVYVTPALDGDRGSAVIAGYQGLDAIHFAGETITCTVVGPLPAEKLRPLATLIFQELSRAADLPAVLPS